MITFIMENWTINRVNRPKDKIGMLSVCDYEIRFKAKKPTNLQQNHTNKYIIVLLSASSELVQN